MNKVEKIKAEIEKRYEYWKEKESNSHSIESESRMSECQYLLLLFDSLQEEPVSNDLEKAAHFYVDTTIEWFDSEGNPCCYPAFKAGAQWQKERDQLTIELAEDHAYLAGQEKILAKACDWLANNYSKYIITNGLSTIFSATIDFDTIRMIEDFKKAVEE